MKRTKPCSAWRRERVIWLTRQIDTLERELKRHNAELDRILGRSPSLSDRTGQFTIDLLHALQSCGEDVVDAAKLAEMMGLPGPSKQLYNSLRTLHRRGHAYRVGHGRWQAAQPKESKQ